MKKTAKIVFASLLTLGTSFSPFLSNACSTVFLNQYKSIKIVGRNMDFMTPNNPSLVISPRGIHRVGSTEGNALEWTSKYGSVITVVCDIFTTDGINEKGLSAHAQAFTNKKQVRTDVEGPVLDSNYWINYILDNHQTVQEVVDDIKKIKMRAVFFPVSYPTDSKHIAIEDKSGDSAVLEINNGTLNIYHGKEYNVMTNYPTLDQHMKKYKELDSKTIPLDWGSNSRFVRLKYNLSNTPNPRNSEEALGYVNSLLNSVAFTIGQPVPEEDLIFAEKYGKYEPNKEELRGATTYWQTLSDLTNKIYYFKPISAPNYLKIDLSDIDFDHLKSVKRLKDAFHYHTTNSANVLDQFKDDKNNIYSHYKAK